MVSTHTALAALYVVLALGASFFTVYLWRRARLYYNRHIWYTLALIAQAFIAITSVVVIATDLHGLAIVPAVLFLVFTCKGRVASIKLINKELNKTKALYNDVK